MKLLPHLFFLTFLITACGSEPTPNSTPSTDPQHQQAEQAQTQPQENPQPEELAPLGPLFIEDFGQKLFAGGEAVIDGYIGRELILIGNVYSLMHLPDKKSIRLDVTGLAGGIHEFEVEFDPETNFEAIGPMDDGTWDSVNVAFVQGAIASYEKNNLDGFNILMKDATLMEIRHEKK